MMRFAQLAATALLLTTSLSAQACLNTMAEGRDYDITGDGRTLHTQYALGSYVELGDQQIDSYASPIAHLLPQGAIEDWYSLGRNVQFDNLKTPEDWQADANKLEKGTTLEQRNDYAVALVHLGKTQEALEVFQALEREKPGQYQVAANMGTAYELLGKDEEALKWIRTGIERNAQSHEGSEWLHVRILEAKMALKKDPTWLKTHSVAGMEFGTNPVPQQPQSFPKGNDGKPLNFLNAYLGLSYQLSERMQFVKPQDPIVADLLFDYGQGAFFLEGVRWSNAVMKGADLYGVQRDSFPERKGAMVKWAQDHPVERQKMPLGVSLFGLLLSLGLTWAWVQTNRRLRQQAPWSGRDKMGWVVGSMFQLTITLALFFAGLLLLVSFMERIHLLLIFAGAMIGLVGHLYGLHLTQRKVWIGSVLWPIGIAFALLTGEGAIMLFGLFLFVTLFVRNFQAGRVRSPRGSLNEPDLVEPVGLDSHDAGERG